MPASWRTLEAAAVRHVVALNAPEPGLDLVAPLDADECMARHHRLDAVRAHLLEMTDDHAAARSSYERAARRTTSLPEQRYLAARAARLTDEDR